MNRKQPVVNKDEYKDLVFVNDFEPDFEDPDYEYYEQDCEYYEEDYSVPPTLANLSLEKFLPSTNEQEEGTASVVVRDTLNKPETHRPMNPPPITPPVARDKAVQFELSGDGRTLKVAPAVFDAVRQTAPQVFAYMLTYLYPKDLARCAMVSKQWHAGIPAQVWRQVAYYPVRYPTFSHAITPPRDVQPLIPRTTADHWARYYGTWTVSSDKTWTNNYKCLSFDNLSAMSAVELSPDVRRCVTLHANQLVLWNITSPKHPREKDTPVCAFKRERESIQLFAVDWKHGYVATADRNHLFVWTLPTRDLSPRQDDSEPPEPLWTRSLSELNLTTSTKLLHFSSDPRSVLLLGFAAGQLLELDIRTGRVLKAHWLPATLIAEGKEQLEQPDHQDGKEREVKQHESNQSDQSDQSVPPSFVLHKPASRNQGLSQSAAKEAKCSTTSLCVFASEGRLVARADANKLQILDLTTGKLSKPFVNHERRVAQLRAFKDGLVSTHEHGAVFVRFMDGQLIRVGDPSDELRAQPVLHVDGERSLLVMTRKHRMDDWIDVYNLSSPQVPKITSFNMNLNQHTASSPLAIRTSREMLCVLHINRCLAGYEWTSLLSNGSGTMRPLFALDVGRCFDMAGSVLVCDQTSTHGAGVYDIFERGHRQMPRQAPSDTKPRSGPTVRAPLQKFSVDLLAPNVNRGRGPTPLSVQELAQRHKAEELKASEEKRFQSKEKRGQRKELRTSDFRS